VATGTLASNTVNSTEKGLVFKAPDGVRIIDFSANISDPIGKDGQGITVPFYNAVVPSRANAAFNGGVYRIQVQNGAVAGNPQQEWWFDVVRNAWSGPHTTGISMITPYNKTFICTLQGGGAKLFQSDQVQSSNSTFVENGAQLVSVYQTMYFPEDDTMSELCTIESTIHMQLPAAASPASPWSSGFSQGFGGADPSRVGIIFVDQNNVVLDGVAVQSTSVGSLWGQFQWGVGRWGGPPDNLFPRRLNWHYPIVFRRGSLIVQAIASAGFKIGEARLRIQELGYLQMDLSASQAFSGGPFILDKSVLNGPDFLVSEQAFVLGQSKPGVPGIILG
jgi:hypothetical protein